MESLKKFEWVRDVAGYRLACIPKRGGKAHWIRELNESWSEKQDLDRSSIFDVSTTQYAGEKGVAKSGIYITGQRQYINRKARDQMWRGEIVRPFQSDEVLSLNLLRAGR